MNAIKRTIRDIFQYPSAAMGASIILVLVILAVIIVIAFPYQKAVDLWRAGESAWYKSPKTAQPKWVNWFRSRDLPETIFLSTIEGTATKTIKPVTEDLTQVIISFPIDYQYDYFPQELSVYMKSNFKEKKPLVTLTWVSPNGEELQMANFSIRAAETYRASQDEKLTRKLNNLPPQQALFVDLKSPTLSVVKGPYELRIIGNLFEPDATLDAEMVLYGQVSGWAGTDHLRRDLTIALMWGLLVALSFGLIAALGTSVTTMIIAAIGVWFSGWVDELIQRITEVNLVLPFLPILIMIGTFYNRSLWVILGATVALGIFGAGIKGYRAIFMQIKESPYIEAARAYGAGNWRIIFRYLLPRIVPVLVPGLVTAIPAYVFLEASLAVLGLGDPVLPTWGKIINDASNNGALYQGQYYWILEPSVLLMLTGLAFALVGFALDRIFNPRLRGV
jgi:peptide/nickel transport system permease protein